MTIPNNHSEESEINTYIGQKIKKRRQILSLTQKEVGRYLGVSTQQIQKLEQGINRISAARLKRLSHYFGVEIEYFFKHSF